MEKDYAILLDQLVQQQIETIEVPHAEFLQFREAWGKRPDRMSIVGEAHLGGNITYRWRPEEETKAAED